MKTEKTGQPFLQRLQSVRGIAALTVSAYHSLEVFSFRGSDEHLLRAISNILYGPGAVFVFFLLSGFVLALTLTKRKPYNFGVCIDFIRRRFLRLFPAILFSSAIYLIYYSYFYEVHDFKPLSGWFSVAHPPISFTDLLSNVSLLSTSFNGVAWSLQVEWLFSLLLPLSYFLTFRFPRANFFIFGLLILNYLFLGWKTFHLTPVNAPWSYLFMCYLGWMLAFYRTPLTAALSRLPRTAIYGLIAAAFFLCVTTPHFGNHFELFVLGAAFLLSVIAFDLTPDLFRFLDNRALIALGNVSYSFYLFHPLFLMLLAEAFLLHAPQTLMASHLWLSTSVLWASSVMATIPFSFLSYRICEHPFTSPHPKPGSGKTPKVALLKPDVSLPASD